MNITVTVSKLQEVLDLVSRFVSKHSTLPVLENVYIKGNVDTLIFRATDMEKYIDIEIPAKIDDEGAITVNAKTFNDIVRTIDDENITLVIDQDKDMLVIKTSVDEFKIKGIPANEYVAVPDIAGGTNITVDVMNFSKGITKVEYSVTERNFSPVLTGVLMKLKKEDNGNKLIFVGTDSFRLAEYKTQFEGDFQDMSIIVPKMNIGDIKKVADYYIEKGGEKMDISFSENLISFTFILDDIKIFTTSLLIQGAFPDYENENIMPTHFNAKIVVNKNDIEKAIRKISILTRDINNFIDMSFEGKSLIIKSGETDMGEAFTNLVAHIEGNAMSLGVNGKYLLDYLKVLEGDEISINIVNSERPMVVREKDDDNYIYVIRPLVK